MSTRISARKMLVTKRAIDLVRFLAGDAAVVVGYVFKNGGNPKAGLTKRGKFDLFSEKRPAATQGAAHKANAPAMEPGRWIAKPGSGQQFDQFGV
jgi:hypothetical protein